MNAPIGEESGWSVSVPGMGTRRGIMFPAVWDLGQTVHPQPCHSILLKRSGCQGSMLIEGNHQNLSFFLKNVLKGCLNWLN